MRSVLACVLSLSWALALMIPGFGWPSQAWSQEATSAPGGEASPPSDATTASSPVVINQTWEARIEAALNRPLSLDFDQTPLSDLASYLESQLLIPARLDRKALEDYGVSADMPMSISLQGLTARDALWHLLRPAELALAIEDGSLLITTHEAASERLATCVYPRRAPTWDYRKPDADTHPQEGGASGIGRLTGGGEAEIDLSILVQPDSWLSNGGDGYATSIDAQLVVRQSHEAHREFQDLLRAFDLALHDVAIGQIPTASQYVAASPQTLQCLQASQQTLSLRLEKTPLSDAAGFFASELGVPVLLDVRGLEDLGVDTETPITFQASGATAAQCLHAVLSPLDLAWVATHGAIVITTRDVSCELTPVRVYPVWDLVEGNQLDALVKVIEACVAPDSWIQAGGDGDLTVYRKSPLILVRQAEARHAEILSLLTLLRAAAQNSSPSPN